HEAHVILRGVSDQIGFAFARLADRTADDDDAGAAAAPGKKALLVMPGLHVSDSSRREYPLDSMDVDIDTSNFPLPLKGGGGRDAIRTVHVPGVGMHLLGRMRQTLFESDLARRPRIDPS